MGLVGMLALTRGPLVRSCLSITRPPALRLPVLLTNSAAEPVAASAVVRGRLV